MMMKKKTPLRSQRVITKPEKRKSARTEKG
jgi:hypothetical protein